MPPTEPDLSLLPSLLDRLTDQPSGSRDDAGASGGQNLRALKESLRRDLENLLNTRWRCVSPLPDPERGTSVDPELETSLVNYGVPDCSSANLDIEANREAFRRLLQSIIRRYEPRLAESHVSFLEGDEAVTRTLRFRIDGVLKVRPNPELVAYSSTLEPANGIFRVKGEAR